MRLWPRWVEREDSGYQRRGPALSIIVMLTSCGALAVAVHPGLPAALLVPFTLFAAFGALAALAVDRRR